MKLIIAGSRNFDNYKLLSKEVTHFIGHNISSIDERLTIVSGGAKGADYLGEQFAKKHDYNLRRFPADWSKHGKAAGPIRNQEMANYATHLIAFPIGDSPGTRDMIRRAKKKGLVVKVIES